MRDRTCCGCCDVVAAYHFVGVIACLEFFGALIFVCLGDLYLIINMILAFILMFSYLRGVCGADQMTKLNAKRNFATIFLVYFILDAIANLINAIIIKVYYDRHPYYRYYYNVNAVFWTLIVYIALYVAFCSYLYSVLKVYYLAEKEMFEHFSQVQPAMYAQPQVMLVQQPQMQYMVPQQVVYG